MIASQAVVHLIDPHGPGASYAAARLAAGVASADSMIALGIARDSAAWKPAWRIPMTAGSVGLAARSLERIVQAAQTRLLVAWGHRACAVAVRAGDSAARVLVMDAVPKVQVIPFDAEVICLGESVANAAMQAGWPPMRVRIAQPPMVDMALPDPDGVQRKQLRNTWGLTDSSMAIGVLPNAPDEGDSGTAFHVVARVRLTGIDAHLILHPHTVGAASMEICARSAGLRHTIHFDQAVRQPEAIASGIDVWISIPGKPVDGSVLDPMIAAGLHAPLVVQSGSFAARAVEHGTDGLSAEGLNRMAAAVRGLCLDPAKRKDLAFAAKVRFATTAKRQAFAGVFAECVQRAAAFDSKVLAASV